MLLCWSSRYLLSPFPAPLFRPSFPRGRGLSTARRPSKSSIAAACLCGRVIWLEKARDTAGRLARDDKNPDPIFRQRPLCGLTVIQGLEPTGLDHWNSGSLYNPEDGQTYRVSAELRSADAFLARIYLGVPLFGETKTLLRVPRLSSEGWC